MLRSRQLVLLFALLICGCRADQATHHAEQMDSNVSLSHAETVYPSQPSEPEKPMTQTAIDARPVVVCFGDSLTAGFGADPGATYPDFLEADLNRSGYAYQVVNDGISGNTTKDGVDRLAAVIARKPAAVVLEFGGNDGLRGLRIEDSRANLDTMLARLTAARIPVMLAGISLPPDYGPDYIAQFNSTYALLAKKYKVPLLPFLLKGVYGVPGMMQADRTHATDAGNKVVAQNVLDVLEPLLKPTASKGSGQQSAAPIGH